jgi:hypothetical protein
MFKRLTPVAVVLLLVAPVAAQLVARPDPDINAKIRKEGMEHSQIMRTLHFLTDVHGPRLTGSPNLKAARPGVLSEAKASQLPAELVYCGR